MLAAEPGLDGHQQQHVQLGQQVGVWLYGRGRIDGEPGARSGRPDLPQGPHRGPGRLGVDRHVARPGLGVARRPAVRVLDHEVAIERQARVLEQRLHHGQADGQVRHEVRVHDVDMQPVGDFRDGRRLVR